MNEVPPPADRPTEPDLGTRAPRRDDSSGSAWTELIEQLSARSFKSSRYQHEGEIARGGMGSIAKVWDNDLHRHLAMKIIRGVDPAYVDSLQDRVLGRFLDEARVTGQLDHPGVVPVHDLGFDEGGRAFFTMRLVKGNDLKQVFRWVRTGEEGWNQTRALNVLLKACEALAYAHSRSVVHRDLKPANIMVGRFGEVYVMDWGLARILGGVDSKDIRPRPEFEATKTTLHTAREEAAESGLDSPLVTMDGDVIGTPVYMSPEQARGELELVDSRSDVYSMGAILYELLAGQMPYSSEGRVSSYMVLRWVREGAPRPVHALAPEVPVELQAICEKAMARERARRYADVDEMAEDLRDFLEGRVVRAYRTGAVIELRKWVQRNKPLAAALASVFVVLVVGLLGAVRLREDALENAALAAAQARLATERADDVLRLSALQDLEDLRRDAADLWPPHPKNIDAYRAWIARGEELVAELPRHRSKLAELRALALPAAGEPGEILFPPDHAEARWWNAQLSKLIGELEALVDERSGLLVAGAISSEHGWSVATRLDFARDLEAAFAPGGEYAARWEAALPAIAAAHDGLALSPQMGLVPIGTDPRSGLFEFWHVASGAEPERHVSGRIHLSEEMGAVLVLVPGGTFWMGAQKEDPEGRNYDPYAQKDEGPIHEVSLAPFFVSKYELTQGQWLRLTGANPSYYQAVQLAPSLLHPVEQVTWVDCMTWLPRVGLSLPTEAQWEYACRAGTDTVWWTGSARESLRDRQAANLADRTAAKASAPWAAIDDWPELDDRYAVHAPIGAYSAQSLGLHEVHGNVWEWCLERYHPEAYARGAEEKAAGSDEVPDSRVARGGSFSSAAFSARSASRNDFTPSYAGSTLGVRPVRLLTD